MTATVAASTVLASVRDVARSAPDRPALSGDAEALSYGELWRRVEETARTLGSRQPDGPGVVRVPAVHDPSTVVAMLAAWAAGGTYCPVDPAYPEAHVVSMLGPLGPDTVGADTAYVLFTSGSTGLPKPVAVPHQALGVVVPALGELFTISPDDRVLQFASLNWDTAFEEVLPTLTAGACVVFGADAHCGSLPRMLRMVERERVTVMDLPTAFWHELVLHLGESGGPLPEHLRLVVIGGEAVDPGRLTAWRGLTGADRIRLLNTYGATETVQITHAVDLHGPESVAPPNGGDLSHDAPAIGRPLPHVVQRLTEAGELMVGGPALATGYPGRPDATAERFVDVDGKVFFRTGDLVREAADGLVHHLGRLDAQVKVRGIRVDPGEVEAHLLLCPGVAAAAVTGMTVSGRTVLAAYVVPAGSREEETPLEPRIRRHLRASAPAHLLPARITVVPRLALTASGKVDRRATHLRYRAPAPTPTLRPLAEEAIP